MDPSIVGRWERTPVVLPILDRLDVIDEPVGHVEGLSQVQPQDLIPLVHEYVMGPSDIIAITVFELLGPNAESVLVRQVDELGMIRLPIIGPVKAQGITASDLEVRISAILEVKGVLRDPTVSVVIQDGRQNTFSVIGEPRLSGTAIGTYLIPQAEFRFLDAMALARGVSGSIKNLFIIRQISLANKTEEVIRSGRQPGLAPRPKPLGDPVDLIDDLLSSVDSDYSQPAASPGELPVALDQSMDSLLDHPAQWVHVNGRWVRAGQPADGQKFAQTATQPAGADRFEEGFGTVAGGESTLTQRIIEVPYDKLLDGDMRYNVVIRPGDVIRVPPPEIGNVYIGGAISRPGTYSLPGDRDLTFKQLVFAAGNLSALAMPERVDLIRRVGNDQEATVRLNLKAIFDGLQPDFYLKPNDTINIGTSFAATPLAVLRSGFRMSYGFGFLLDRNFGTDVFGPIETRNR